MLYFFFQDWIICADRNLLDSASNHTELISLPNGSNQELSVNGTFKSRESLIDNEEENEGFHNTSATFVRTE